jgi:hypothetical protein
MRRAGEGQNLLMELCSLSCSYRYKSVRGSLWILQHKFMTVMLILCCLLSIVWSQCSSVSIVSKDWTTGRLKFDPRQRRKDLSCRLSVQTSSGAHPTSCTMGTGVLSSGVKHSRGVTLTTHPHLVLRSRMSRSYTSSAPLRLHRCVVGLLYLYHPLSEVHCLSGEWADSVFACSLYCPLCCSIVAVWSVNIL